MENQDEKNKYIKKFQDLLKNVEERLQVLKRGAENTESQDQDSVVNELKEKKMT